MEERRELPLLRNLRTLGVLETGVPDVPTASLWQSDQEVFKLLSCRDCRHLLTQLRILSFQWRAREGEKGKKERLGTQSSLEGNFWCLIHSSLSAYDENTQTPLLESQGNSQLHSQCSWIFLQKKRILIQCLERKKVGRGEQKGGSREGGFSRP